MFKTYLFESLTLILKNVTIVFLYVVLTENEKYQKSIQTNFFKVLFRIHPYIFKNTTNSKPFIR